MMDQTETDKAADCGNNGRSTRNDAGDWLAAAAVDVMVAAADMLGEDQEHTADVLLLAAAELIRPRAGMRQPARTAAMLHHALGEALDAFQGLPPAESVGALLPPIARTADGIG